MAEIKNASIFQLDDISDEEMLNMVDGTITDFEEGELVTGTVVNVEHDEVLLDIGFKSEGVIPRRELTIKDDADINEIVAVGDKIEALVVQKEDKEGRLVLSKKRAEYRRAWNDIEEKYKNGETVEGEVIEVVKGGLILDIGLRGFLPASLVDLRRVKDLDSYLGTVIEARVIEMDRNRNNVVLSRRVLLEEGRKNERAEIISKLQKDMRLKGTVSSIVEFGTFVDLGGIDGLVHISELSWSHVNHPSEVVSVGQEVEVVVLDVDMERERISLGLKQTTEDPWAKLVDEYPEGAIVEGTVTKVVPFGVFVSLGEDLEGLVHISEMATKHVNHPKQVVNEGDVVNVKVISLDSSRRRVSLSMKAAAETLGVDIDVKPLDDDMSEDIKANGGQDKEANIDLATDINDESKEVPEVAPDAKIAEIDEDTGDDESSDDDQVKETEETKTNAETGIDTEANAESLQDEV